MQEDAARRCDPNYFLKLYQVEAKKRSGLKMKQHCILKFQKSEFILRAYYSILWHPGISQILPSKASDLKILIITVSFL